MNGDRHGEPPIVCGAIPQHHDGAAPDTPDAELAQRVRDGGPDAETAFAALHQRHHAAGLRHARRLEADRDAAEDLVSDAFVEVLAQLRRGGGPRESFRAYLCTTMRNAFIDRAKARKGVLLTGDDAELDSLGGPSAESAEVKPDLMLVQQAFGSLPDRWQAVLWHTEVEGEKPRAIARLLGITPNAVSQLAVRAREGLSAAFLEAHVGRLPDRCRDYGTRFGGYVRGTLRIRDKRAVDDHLAGCDTCTRVCAELTAANAHLRALLLPAVLGTAAAAAPLIEAATGGAAVAPGPAGTGSGAPGLPGPHPDAAWKLTFAAGAVAMAGVAFAAILAGSGDDSGRHPDDRAPRIARPAPPEPPGPSAGSARQSPAPADSDASSVPGGSPSALLTAPSSTAPKPAEGEADAAAPPATAASGPPRSPGPESPHPTAPPTTRPAPTRPPATTPPPTPTRTTVPPTTRPPTQHPAPLAADDAATVRAGGTVALDVLANDRGDRLRMTGAPLAFGRYGLITCDKRSGACTYRTYDGFRTGTDVFSYTVKDAEGRTDSASVRITVTAR